MILAILCRTSIFQLCLVSAQPLEKQVVFRRHHKTRRDPGQSSPLWRDRRCDPWICSACWELSNCQGVQWMTRDFSDAGRSWQALSYSEGYGVFNSRTFKDVGLQPSARLFNTMSVHWKLYFETLLQCFVKKYVVQRQQKQTIENHLLFKTHSLKYARKHGLFFHGQ